MITANEHIKSIQSRIDELEQTISERGEQIKSRAVNLKAELQEELAPEELIRRHPFKSTGSALLVGLLVGRAFKSVVAPARRSAPVSESQPAKHREPSAMKVALATIGAEALYAGKDLAISWMKSYIEEKKKKPA
jgi:hypothetical protein